MELSSSAAEFVPGLRRSENADDHSEASLTEADWTLVGLLNGREVSRWTTLLRDLNDRNSHHRWRKRTAIRLDAASPTDISIFACLATEMISASAANDQGRLTLEATDADSVRFYLGPPHLEVWQRRCALAENHREVRDWFERNKQ